MAGRGEARHVNADLGHDLVRADIAQARHGAQQLDGLSKRLEHLAHLLFQLGNGFIQRVNVAQVQLEHEAVVRADVYAQGFEHVGSTGLDSTTHARGQSLGIGLTVNERLQHGTPALAQDIAEHDTELEVGVFEHLLDALDVGAPIAHELLSGARERAQLLHGHRWHETRADQAVGKQVGQPHRVVDVGLAPGHVLDLCGVGPHQLKVAVEHMPHGLPVHAGGLHGNVLGAQGFEPVGQLKQARCGGGKGTNFLLQWAVTGHSRTRHHGLLVHVQARTARINDIHDRLQCAATSACGPRHRTLGCVVKGAGPKATVRGAREAAGPTDIRVRGTKYKPTSLPEAASELHIRFMRRGSRAARWSN